MHAIWMNNELWMNEWVEWWRWQADGLDVCERDREVNFDDDLMMAYKNELYWYWTYPASGWNERQLSRYFLNWFTQFIYRVVRQLVYKINIIVWKKVKLQRHGHLLLLVAPVLASVAALAIVTARHYTTNGDNHCCCCCVGSIVGWQPNNAALIWTS